MLQIEVGVQRTPGEDDDRGEPRGKPHTSLAMSPGSQSPNSQVLHSGVLTSPNPSPTRLPALAPG